MAKDLINDIKERIRNSPIFIAGGYGPAFSPEYYLSFVDYVFIGESEDALPILLNNLDALGKNKTYLKNVAYFSGIEVVKQNIVPLELEVSCYGRDVFIPEASLVFNNQILHIDPIKAPHHKYFFMAGRGCVGACSYCSSGYWRNLYPTNIKIRRNRTLRDLCKMRIFSRIITCG